MKPSWTEVASLALLLGFGLVMANGWPPSFYVYIFGIMAAAAAIKRFLDVVLFWGYFSGKRKPNQFQANKVRDFSRDYDNNSFAVFRVCIAHIRDNEKDKLSRKQWVKISCNNTNRHIYRKVLGGPGLRAGQIELDYDSLLELDHRRYSVKDFRECSFNFAPITSTHELIAAHWRHPSDPYRIPIRIALVSLALGIISIAISVDLLSFFKP